MENPNPYQPPETPTPDFTDEPKPCRRPIVPSGILLCIGAGYLLLLNGQFFTNTLVFLGLCTLSLLLWATLLIPSPRNPYRRLALYVVLVHVAVMVPFAAALPARYQSQRSFNEMIERIRSNTESQ